MIDILDVKKKEHLLTIRNMRRKHQFPSPVLKILYSFLIRWYHCTRTRYGTTSRSFVATCKFGRRHCINYFTILKEAEEGWISLNWKEKKKGGYKGSNCTGDMLMDLILSLGMINNLIRWVGNVLSRTCEPAICLGVSPFRTAGFPTRTLSASPASHSPWLQADR